MKKPKCPKCGCTYIYTKWVGKGMAWRSLSYESSHACRTEAEHLHRHCPGCSYNWDDLTNDQARGSRDGR